MPDNNTTTIYTNKSFQIQDLGITYNYDTNTLTQNDKVLIEKGTSL